MEPQTASSGKFIVFEGLDGCGKTTQAGLLSGYFDRCGIDHISTYEPSAHNPIGNLIRQYLHGGGNKMENETLGLLFAADRIQHTLEIIIPALLKGKYVICDRYYYSNFAYQSYECKIYNKYVMEKIRPDLVIFIDVSPEECLNRIKTRKKSKSPYESKNELVRVRQNYLEIINKLKNTENIITINADYLTETQLHEKIITYYKMNCLH